MNLDLNFQHAVRKVVDVKIEQNAVYYPAMGKLQCPNGKHTEEKINNIKYPFPARTTRHHFFISSKRVTLVKWTQEMCER